MPAGRPAIQATDKITGKVCKLVRGGSNLARIGREKNGLPGKTLLYEWLAEDVEFAERYARAREQRSASREDEIDRLIEEQKHDKDARSVNSRRLQIDALKWLMGKERPKVYGDRLDLTGETTVRVTHTTEQLAKAVMEALEGTAVDITPERAPTFKLDSKPALE